MVTAAVLAHETERFVDADTHQGQQDTLCLLDKDPAVQSRLELFGDQVGLVYGALLEEADGGDVGERLRKRRPSSSGVACAGG